MIGPIILRILPVSTQIMISKQGRGVTKLRNRNWQNQMNILPVILVSKNGKRIVMRLKSVSVISGIKNRRQNHHINRILTVIIRTVIQISLLKKRVE